MEHIADIEGYDHILFLTALCAVYDFSEIKKLLILITAFTLGHSVTLALSVLDIIRFPSAIIEFLIPVTILITCVLNFFKIDNKKFENIKWSYLLALFFGFIHGTGFSYLLKSLLGKEEQIIYPLFAFNLGLEAGQILILLAVLIISLILTALIKVKQRDVRIFFTSASFGIALIMTIERFNELIR
jgi:hypothetical protein